MAQAQQIRILSVEDHPVFSQGLATIIETEPDMVLVGQVANGGEAIAEFRRHRPDITLMDLRLPGHWLKSRREMQIRKPKLLKRRTS